jgi:hypothetical protein
MRRGKIHHAHRFKRPVMANGDSNLGELIFEDVLPVPAPRDAVIHQQLDDDFAGQISAIWDALSDSATPGPVPGDPCGDRRPV